MSKLEEEVNKLYKKEEDARNKRIKEESEKEKKEEKIKRERFLKVSKVIFARLFKLVDVTIGNASWVLFPNSLQFDYKGNHYFISEDYYEYEPGGVDDYGCSGYEWLLKLSHNGYDYGNTVKLYPKNETNDITNQVIKGLKYIEEHKNDRRY